MAKMQILPYKRFYKVDIREVTVYEKTSTMGLILKIWHVDMGRQSSSPCHTCRIETFRRIHDDQTILQSERGLWAKLAMINDDIKLLFDNSGTLVGIANLEDLQKKAAETCLAVREGFNGDVIEKLLSEVNTLYNSSILLLPELGAYKQFGLLTSGLHDHDLNTKIRQNIVYLDTTTTDVKECFTIKENEDGFIHFILEGTVKNPHDKMPKLDFYGGTFIFESKTNAIHKANVEIAFSGSGYHKKRTYALQSLSEKDMEYL